MNFPKKLTERARIVREIRNFFETRGFLEVETPIVVPSPGMDLHLCAFVARGEKLPDRYLITSPEYQMKRLVADGYPRIFQITKAFRDGEVGQRHNPEFTILEWYRAHATVLDVMQDTESLVELVTRSEVQLGERRVRTRSPFARITLADAFERYAQVRTNEMLDWAENDEDRFFKTLVDRVEPGLAALDEAIFVTDFPASQASLARRKSTDPRFAERFELYVAGVELCNGFGELTDPAEQRARFVRDQEARGRAGLPVYPIDERFMDALERGMPDCAGNAVGVDRLVALACGTTHIGDVLAFSFNET